MPKSPYHKKRVPLILAIDVFSIVLSILAAYYIRFYSFMPTDRGIPPIEPYLIAGFLIVPVYLWFLNSYKLYETSRHLRRIEEMFRVVRASTVSIIILTAFTFFYREFSYSRTFLLILWILSGLLLGAGRYLLIAWEYSRKRRQQDLIHVLIIGSGIQTRRFIRWAKNNPHYGYHIIGILTRDRELLDKHLEDASIIGSVEDYAEHVKNLKPDQVILMDKDFSRDQIVELAVYCDDALIEFKMAADFLGLVSQNIDVEYLSNISLLGLRSLPLDDWWQRMLKRSFDLVFSLSVILGTAPIWIVLVALIKLQDGGPIFYKQERVGRNGKTFNVLKFRTMRVNAEDKSGPVWAAANDDRKTPIGGFLRKFNLDEIPQFLNVLQGNMSVVGPRPERPHFVDQFRGTIPRYMARHQVKAGITGWAQVNGLRGNTSIQERIKYDLYYMENWSLLFDIEIIIMTLFAFKNAY